MTVTAHKLGGPVGVGALLARRDARLVPLVHGGGQERQVRVGHPRRGRHPVASPSLVEATVAERDVEAQARSWRCATGSSRGALALGLGITGAAAAGPPATAPAGCRATRTSLVPGCEGDSLLYLLDAAGVECSTGSACQAGVPQPSHVLLAMGLPEAEARGALRLSLGHTSTEADVDAVPRRPARRSSSAARRAGGLL